MWPANSHLNYRSFSSNCGLGFCERLPPWKECRTSHCALIILISSSLTNQGMPWFLLIFYSDNSVIINSDNSALSQICPIVISTCLPCCRSMAPMSWTCAVDLVARCSSAMFFAKKRGHVYSLHLWTCAHAIVYYTMSNYMLWLYTILYYVILLYIYYLSPQIWVHTYHM
jgi:hypothetical protein